MSVLIGFIIFVMSVLLIYMGYRLFLRRNAVVLAVICMQVLAITIAVLSFARNVMTNNYVELCFIVFGIIIPGAFFTYDYFRMMKKFREQGIYEGFLDMPEKEDIKEIDMDFNKKQINPIIKELQVPELMKDLNLNKDDILKNVKKNLSQSQILINNKDYENACDIYNTFIKLIKNSPGLYYNRGNICYLKGDYIEAVQSYKKVLEINEKLIEDIKSPREVLFADKSNKEVLGSIKDEDDIKYQEYMVLYNLGNSKFKLGNFDQAIEYYKKALEINPNLEDANENIARSLIATGKEDEALEYYMKIVEGDKNNYRVHHIIARLYNDINKYDEAIEKLNECIRIKPDYAEAHEDLGKVLVKVGNNKKAAEVFERVLELKPDDYKVYYNLGTTYYQSGLKEKAIECFKKVIQHKGDDYKSFYNMAIAMDEIGSQDEAIDAFKKVIEIKPDFIDTYNNLGILLSTQGRRLEALDIYTKGLKKNPEDYSLYYNMGITLSEMGKYSEAAEAYKNALEINPDQYEINYHLGAALIELKRYNEALELYKATLKVKPSDSELHYNLSTVYTLLKKYDIAIDNLKKSIELNPELKEDARSDKVFDVIRNRKEFKQLVS